MIVWAQGWSDPTGNEPATLQDVEVIFRIVLNYAVRLAGITFFIMLLAGGFKYLTAGGNQEKLQSAKKTISLAIIGLLLMILAWFILLLIKEFTGIDVTLFKIPR